MDSFLVIGAGRFGRSVAVELHKMKQDVLVVDKNEENIASIVDKVPNVIIGDVRDEAVLRSLGVQNFSCVVVAIASNLESSILTTMMLKEMDARFIVCKAQNERHANILHRIGADKVSHPELDMGKRVAFSLVHKNVIDFIEVSPEHSIMEISVPRQWVGKSILKSDLRKKHGITIISIQDKLTNKVNFSPDAETILHEHDIITFIGRKKNLESVSTL